MPLNQALNLPIHQADVGFVILNLIGNLCLYVKLELQAALDSRACHKVQSVPVRLA